MKTTILCLVGCLVVAGCAVHPNKGDRAPSFTAKLDSGKEATLEQLMGDKGVVLYFYPKDETPGCTTQACEFQDKLVEFQDRGYRVVGVSVDTGESHQAFKSKHTLTFDLVADTKKEIAALYNIPTEADPVGTVGFRRTTFIIARDGMIVSRFEQPDPKEQVYMALERIRQPF